MKRRLLVGLMAVIAIASPKVPADPPTPDPLRTQVQTHLRVDVDQETDTVHFISTSNDPYIITKTYLLKHADPYELRPYLQDALQAERITGGDSKIEAIKYNDGTGFLLVSAEDYKFDKAMMNGGDTIDEIIAKLDQPKITSSSGKSQYLYFPRYRSAADLATLLANVGMDAANSFQENQRGQDRAYVDAELNSVFFYPSKFSVKNISEMITAFDQPVPEVKVRFKIYELEGENDDKLGVDFQSWKNGPGTDLFAAANRFANGWDFVNQAVAPNDLVRNSHTQFIKFNPKWNTRFIDFLTAQGKAKVVTGGELSIQNEQEGRVQAMTEYAAFATGPANPDLTAGAEYASWTNASLQRVDVAGAGPGIQINAAFDIFPTDFHGNPITVNVAAATDVAGFTISRVWDGTRHHYWMEMPEPANAQVWFVVLHSLNANPSATNYGYRIRCLGNFDETPAWSIDRRYNIARNNDRITNVNPLNTAGDVYGFSLRLIPSICAESTTLDVNAYNTSLVGFANNGAPRTERSEINTRVILANDGSRFVIGGIEKRHTVRSISKVPLLGSLPIIGYLLASESEVGKNSQIVVVLDCVTIMPDTAVDAARQEQIKAVNDRTGEAGEKLNPLGFDQFLLDPDKSGI